MSILSKAIQLGSTKLGKDYQGTYEQYLGGISVPQEKLQQQIQLGKMKNGGKVKKNGRRKK
jgi:hypothetical protein